MADLLNVDDAVRKVLQDIMALQPEMIDLEAALGRVLAEDVVADANIPPFANSSMDGFAVRAADIIHASDEQPVRLAVVMDIPAGTAATQAIQAGQSARIMTGAPMPEGADSVVPVENTDAQWKPEDDSKLPPAVKILRSIKFGDYVRPAGEDIQAGQVVLKSGTPIRAQEIGLMVSVGRSKVQVVRRPRVTIVSTGDELVGLGEPLEAGKIRDSNSYTLAALVSTYGGEAIRVPVARDTLDDVRRRFREALEQKPDLILSSAGVSVGAFDVVRTVIDELGSVNFWRINLRPGKPLAFGELQGVPFFGLPGNPVSAMVTFDVFVRPVLLKMGSQHEHLPTIQAVLGESVRSDGRRSYLRVKLAQENGEWVARMTGTQSSGALTSMALADGLMIVPEDQIDIPIGSKLPVRLLRELT